MEDAEAALAIYGDPRVMRYLGSAGATGGAPPVPDVEAMRQRLERVTTQSPDKDGLPGMLARGRSGRPETSASLMPVSATQFAGGACAGGD